MQEKLEKLARLMRNEQRRLLEDAGAMGRVPAGHALQRIAYLELNIAAIENILSEEKNGRRTEGHGVPLRFTPRAGRSGPFPLSARSGAPRRSLLCRCPASRCSAAGQPDHAVCPVQRTCVRVLLPAALGVRVECPGHLY